VCNTKLDQVNDN